MITKWRLPCTVSGDTLGSECIVSEAVDTPLLHTTSQMENLANALLDRFANKWDLVTATGPAQDNPVPGELVEKNDVLLGAYKAKLKSVKLSLSISGKEFKATHTLQLYRRR